MKPILILLFCLSNIIANGADYYWVGGGGNWSDLSHWATTSGGTINHDQVPTSEDNVIFDENSFDAPNQTVNLNTDLVFVLNLNFTAVDENVILFGNKNINLKCFGDLLFSDKVTFNYKGNIYFNGSPQQAVLDFANNGIAGDIFINGAGSWKLESKLFCRKLTLTKGTFIASNQLLEMDYFEIDGTNSKTLDIAGAIVRIKGEYRGRIQSVEINSDNLSLICDRSKISFAHKSSSLLIQGKTEINLDSIFFANAAGYARIHAGNGSKINIKYLKLSSNTDLLTSIKVDFLDLEGNKLYRFLSGGVFRIESIIAPSGCKGNISLKSTNKDREAFFQTSNSVVVSHANIRDIFISEGEFMAENSSDMGNNDGWIFLSSTALDYYWIGGSGEWLDGNNWSLSSGGPPSGCIPLAKDNAIFDANSFYDNSQTVKINEDVFIHNMIWESVSGSPDIKGSISTAIHINGSLRLDANMNHSFEGNYYFESSKKGNTIEVNTKKFNRDIYFSGVDGEWTFIDDIYVYRRMFHNSGSVITGGNSLDLWQYYSRTSDYRHFDFSDSYITTHDITNDTGKPIGRPRIIIWPNNNYTNSSNNSTIEFNSSYQVDILNQGPNQVTFNNVIFTNRHGAVHGKNPSEPDKACSVFDTLIFKKRGSLLDDIDINYLDLASGFDYEFDAAGIVNINYLNANGTCDEGSITLMPTVGSLGRDVKVDIRNPTTFDRLSLTDITNVTKKLIANNSVDNGGNDNWVINEAQSRTLYWVGSSGAWHDKENWSLTSGGRGGECIPTPIDDVIFDENSFEGSNNGVYTLDGRIVFCRDFTWHNIAEVNTLGNYRDPLSGQVYNMPDLYFYGSVHLSKSLNNKVVRWHSFAANDATFLSNGGQMLDLLKKGVGSLSFTDLYQGRRFYHYRGHIELKNITMNLQSLYETDKNASNISANFNNSDIHFLGIRSNFRDLSPNYDFDAGRSTLYFHGITNVFINKYSRNYHRIISTNPLSHTWIGDHPNYTKPNLTREPYDLQLVKFAGDGTIIGFAKLDSLIGSPGKIYVLEENKFISISNYLQLIGNNCTPIELRSTEYNQMASIKMPAESKIVVDFVEMRDNNGYGGANFIAGPRSTNVNNSNKGWKFDDVPEYIDVGFLGPDRALCNNKPIELSAFNFSPSESYLWDDNSTDTTRTIKEFGTYFVDVSFSNGCNISDTINILKSVDLELDLGNDTTLCEGETLILKMDDPNVSYRHHLKRNFQSIFEFSNTGDYIIEGVKEGCVVKDTIFIDFVEPPDLLMNDTLFACEGDELSLMVSNQVYNYSWSTGSQDSSITVNESGIYKVSAQDDYCASVDSTVVEFFPYPEIDLGEASMSFCEGDEIELNVQKPGLWQDGSFGSYYLAHQEGWYKVTVNNEGCAASDSVFLALKPLPNIDLGPNISLCEGETAILSVADNYDTHIWDNGSTETDREIGEPSVYWLEVEKNGCVNRDSIIVSVKKAPQLDLGRNVVICDDEDYYIEPLIADGRILWQDSIYAEEFWVEEPGQIYAKVISDDCETYDSIYVDFKRCMRFEAYLPNIFSPNSDGNNDSFSPEFPEGVDILDYKLAIYDRWGSQVFESSDQEEEWDGTMNSSPLSSGVYVYVMVVEYRDDYRQDNAVISGDVTIVK